MIQMFYGLLQWFARGGVASFMVGAGLTAVTAVGMDALLTHFLQLASSNMGALVGAALQIALLSGVGEFVSIIGSALLTRAALVAATKSLGLIKSTPGDSAP